MPFPIPVLIGGAALALYLYSSSKKPAAAPAVSGGGGATPPQPLTPMPDSNVPADPGKTSTPATTTKDAVPATPATWTRGDTSDLSGRTGTAGIPVPGGPYGFSTTPVGGDRTVSPAERSNAWQRGFLSGADSGFDDGNAKRSGGPDLSQVPGSYGATPYGGQLAADWTEGAGQGYAQGQNKAMSGGAGVGGAIIVRDRFGNPRGFARRDARGQVRVFDSYGRPIR
jgi:hypothetical protein